MIKKIISLLAAAVFCFAGCADDAAVSGGYTFTDDFGRTVTVTSHERTAVLLGSFADIWTLAGGEICASAADAWEDFGLALPETTVNLGSLKTLSLEGLFAADPDFVIAGTRNHQDAAWQETLDAAGITAAYFDVLSFDDYLRMLKICTDITGREDLYEKHGTDVRTTVEKTIADAEKRAAEHGAPTVLLLRAAASGVKAKGSEGTVLGEMLADLGCVNIADSEESLLENLSLESILAADPDRIFVVPMGGDTEESRAIMEAMFAENPAWNELTAVREGRIYYMDKRLYNLKPNARWGEAYEKLEAILAE
ncbi:MAG: ABC transporter substrate-binding protein [Clostridia bacterium]|nr:ABC transporter substrate-binding protein [Clostridia bacterium]